MVAGNYRVLRPFPIWNQTIQAERTIEISDDIAKALIEAGVLMPEEEYQKHRADTKARKEAKKKAEAEAKKKVEEEKKPKPVESEKTETKSETKGKK